ncbi:hypothetical protein [Pseudomonas sp. 2FE]|uniref:hypothetical protein n=1 Tax=Pseudomonas sp. 2FE TaxID=2502190 RepID=UPI0010F8FC81|nr:hypothetical protein [Pseudomonas sp. 2FE]
MSSRNGIKDILMIVPLLGYAIVTTLAGAHFYEPLGLKSPYTGAAVGFVLGYAAIAMLLRPAYELVMEIRSFREDRMRLSLAIRMAEDECAHQKRPNPIQEELV